MVERKLDAKTKAISALEERFSFAKGAVADIEKTKAMIAHPGWVQLTAAHPTSGLPRLERMKPIAPEMTKLQIPEMRRMGLGAGKIELSLAIPEMGEKMKPNDGKKS